MGRSSTELCWCSNNSLYIAVPRFISFPLCSITTTVQEVHLSMKVAVICSLKWFAKIIQNSAVRGRTGNCSTAKPGTKNHKCVKKPQLNKLECRMGSNSLWTMWILRKCSPLQKVMRNLLGRHLCPNLHFSLLSYYTLWQIGDPFGSTVAQWLAFLPQIMKVLALTHCLTSSVWSLISGSKMPDWLSLCDRRWSVQKVPPHLPNDKWNRL